MTSVVKIFAIVLLLIITDQSYAQTIGGDAIYNFLKLSPSPQLSALGVINVSHANDDVTVCYSNPASLTDSMDGQLSANFTLMFAGIKNYFLITAWHANAINTNFATSVNYFSYGSLSQTDPSGNILGEFNPKDFLIQLSASRAYADNWNYGTSFKIISSDYGIYKSSALAMDFGIYYHDKNKTTSIGFVAKNMGFQLKTYANQKEDLPFDLQLGITKKLNIPVYFSVTAHRLHQFKWKNFVLASQVWLSEKLNFTVGYNNVRKQELNIANSSNGFTAFSMGAGLHLSRLQIGYARAYYQSASAYNQLGINFTL